MWYGYRELENYFLLFSKKGFNCLCFCIKGWVNSRFFLFLLKHPERQLAPQEEKRRVAFVNLCEYKNKTPT